MTKPALTGTKLALLEAAGELFAEHGLEGTNIRAIAEKAQANIAAVNYHFGTKENLYTEALRHVATCAPVIPPEVFLARLRGGGVENSPEAVIRDLVQDRVSNYLSKKSPEWHTKLLMRSLLEPNQALEQLIQQIFTPDQDGLMELVLEINPKLSPSQARILVFSMIGQCVFYVFAKAPILILLKKEGYDDAFTREIGETVSRIMMSALYSFP